LIRTRWPDTAEHPSEHTGPSETAVDRGPRGDSASVGAEVITRGHHEGDREVMGDRRSSRSVSGGDLPRSTWSSWHWRGCSPGKRQRMWDSSARSTNRDAADAQGGGRDHNEVQHYLEGLTADTTPEDEWARHHRLTESGSSATSWKRRSGFRQRLRGSPGIRRFERMIPGSSGWRNSRWYPQIRVCAVRQRFFAPEITHFVAPDSGP
jgi:hypothetical protein